MTGTAKSPDPKVTQPVEPKSKEQIEETPTESPNVLANKTPSELSSETPEETAKRYNIPDEAMEAVRQVPSSTHLHPDILKDMHQRGLTDVYTDSGAMVQTVKTDFDFADDAEVNDKMPKS